MNQHIRNVSIAVVLAACSVSCLTMTPSSGKIVDGQYSPLSGTYTVPVPVVKQFGGAIKDGVGFVRFGDDLGSLYTIEMGMLTSGDQNAFRDVGAKTFLKRALEERYFTQIIQGSVPGAKIVRKSFDEKFRGGALYLEVLLPGAASYTVQSLGGPKKQGDARRGVLAFVQKGRVYVVTTDQGVAIFSGADEARMKSLSDALLEGTKVFAGSIVCGVGLE